MVDEAMVEEVRGLLKEGYSLDKIKANLVKIGFSDADADGIIAAAQPKPSAAAAPEEDLGLAMPPEEASEEDMLLAAGNNEPIAGPAAAPPKPGPRAPPRPPPKAEPPASMSEEGKPKSGAGKAFFILLLALIAVAALAYFILFPKLGIEVVLPFELPF